MLLSCKVKLGNRVLELRQVGVPVAVPGLLEVRDADGRHIDEEVSEYNVVERGASKRLAFNLVRGAEPPVPSHKRQCVIDDLNLLIRRVAQI